MHWELDQRRLTSAATPSTTFHRRPIFPRKEALTAALAGFLIVSSRWNRRPAPRDGRMTRRWILRASTQRCPRAASPPGLTRKRQPAQRRSGESLSPQLTRG